MTTLLSNLIKRDDYGNIKIEAFAVNEIEADSSPCESSSDNSSTDEDHLRGVEDRISKIEMEAYEKGFQQGQIDGMALGKKRLEESAKRLEAVVRSLSALKSEIFKKCEEEVVQLAVQIARKIINKELEVDNEAVLRTIRRAMSFLNERSSVRILLNPDDMEKVTEALPEIKAEKKIDNIELAEDPAVERGGCVLETGFGTINANIEDQFATIAEELEEELRSG